MWSHTQTGGRPGYRVHVRDTCYVWQVHVAVNLNLECVENELSFMEAYQSTPDQAVCMQVPNGLGASLPAQ